MAKEEVFREIARISTGYTVFQCVDCARSIKSWLKQNNIAGVHLQISAVGRMKFIVSNRWEAGRDSIAQTGVHQGFEVYGKVFDNLAPDGLNRDDWIADFDCASERFNIIELESF